MQPFDTLVDIGAGDGAVNAMYSIAVPDVHQVLVDIDEKKLTEKRVNAHFRNLQKSYQSKNRYSYQLVLNKSNSLPFVSSSYKKVLCRRSFHEFTEPASMVQEMHRILKDSGTVVIIEGVPTQKIKMDPGCQKPYVSSDFIIKTFESNGFVLQDLSEEIMWFDNNRKLSLLTFKKVTQPVKESLALEN